jgi:hypothetical protein
MPTARQRRSQRRRHIVAVCQDARNDSLYTSHGLDPVNYERDALYELVMECCSFDYMSDPEKRLAVVAFEQGMTAAKESVWWQ